MSNESFTDFAEASPELCELETTIDGLWQDAWQSPETFPDFEVTHDGERASFTNMHTPTIYGRLELFRNHGVWVVVQQEQRPCYEHEGSGGFIRTTTTQVLRPNMSVSTLAEQIGPSRDGTTQILDCKLSEQLLSPEICSSLQRTLKRIRGMETEHPKRRRRSGIRGWLAKLGLAR